MFTSTIPTRCIEYHPGVRTLVFAGVPISLTALSRAYNPPLNRSYLSQIFSRTRDLDRIPYGMVRSIAEGLGMQPQAFCDELTTKGTSKYQRAA